MRYIPALPCAVLSLSRPQPNAAVVNVLPFEVEDFAKPCASAEDGFENVLLPGVCQMQDFINVFIGRNVLYEVVFWKRPDCPPNVLRYSLPVPVPEGFEGA